MTPDQIGNIFIGPDHLKKCTSETAIAIVLYRMTDYKTPQKLACDIRDYLNMQEEAKDELMKNKTIASAVLQRMGREPGT